MCSLRRFYGFQFALIGLILTNIGCGGGADLPETVPTTGTVKLDGAPLSGVTVQFIPDDAEKRSASGTTDDSGNYSLQTFRPGDGAIPGSYKVTVVRPPADDAVPDKTAAAPVEEMAGIPAKYTSPATTDIKVTVEAAGSTIPIELKSGG
ncbi:MAG: carboxypeptidase-like regulatory domain-containing protein [Planctomycetaceae bacterium]